MPREPKSIGEHIRKRRLELHLMQETLAREFGVHIESVKNWERGVHEPNANVLPRVLDFLGYDPREPSALVIEPRKG